MAIRILGWGIALAAAAGAVYYFTQVEPPLDVTAVSIERGAVEETVAPISSGTVLAEADSLVASSWMGVIVEVPVKEGQEVAPGDVLVVLDYEELDAHVRLAQANLAAGESQLAKARIAAEISSDISGSNVSLATERLRSALQDYERAKELQQQGASSRSDLDKAELQWRVAQQDLEAARAGQRENLVSEQDIAAAESNVEQLAAALAVAEVHRAKATIRAPFAGVVADILMDVGEAVNVGMPLVQLVRADEILVEAPFDEANAAEIRVGQRARVNIDAYRETDFEGEVVYIAPVVTTNPDLSRTLNVKIRVTKGDENFMAGMSADVTIIVDEKADVVYAPSDAIIQDRFAYVAANGRAQKREVETGIGNWSRREILSGLEAGDVLITSVSLPELDDGVRVRVTQDQQ